MNKDSHVFVAGHSGLAGSAIVRKLLSQGYKNILTVDHSDVDLLSERAVNDYFSTNKPEYVFMAAARVGSLLANSTYPVQFLRENLLIQTHVIEAAYRHKASKLLFLGSSCIYPKDAPQPIIEESLLSGPLEPTNEWYAIAKIAGIKLCGAYRKQYDFDAISLMAVNLYGPGDNFNLEGAHVLPALIRKFYTAKTQGDSQVMLWGTGTPRREFLYVDDLADAALFLMLNYSDDNILNIGVGKDIPIRELADIIAEVVGFQGEIVLDSSKPDGVSSKLLDVSRARAMGWTARTSLRDGIENTFQWFLENQDNFRS